MGSRLSTIIDPIRSNTIEQPVIALPLVNHRESIERILWHLVQVARYKLVQTAWSLFLVAPVTTECQFDQEQPFVRDGCVMLGFRALINLSDLPPKHGPG